MGRTQKWKLSVTEVPHNPWFEEECKVAKRMLRMVAHLREEWDHVIKECNAFKRRKERMYELTREEQDVNRFKRDPKKSWWRQMKGTKGDIMGNFSRKGDNMGNFNPKDMYDYVQQLYAPEVAQGMIDKIIQVGLEKEMAIDEVGVRPCDILEVYQNEMSTEQGLAGEKRKKRRGLGKEMANDEV
ncbi:hypothetical protein L7F22_026799 [Adiantum nelumboides]|nr:hypothetical protein [Adiantum nelumboides]